MAFANPTYPNLADFITFCQTQGVEVGFLPVTSDYYQWALTYAENIVVDVPQIPDIQYVIAVYNLGFHWLIGHAPDVTAANTSLVWASGVVTVTTTAALGLTIGETFPVSITGAVPIAYNGSYTGTVTGASTFTYPLATDPGAETTAGNYTLSFFADLRKQYKLLSFVPGVTSSSSDQGTSQSWEISEFFKNATLSTLDLLKTPWGRAYLEYAQAYGPSEVGFS